MVIRRAHLDERNVDGDPALLEEPRDLAEEDGGVVRATLRDRLPNVRADEEGVVPEVVAPFRLRVRREAERHDVDDLGTEDRVRAFHERFHEPLGLGGPGPDEDVIPALDGGHGLGRIAHLLLVPLDPLGRFRESGFRYRTTLHAHRRPHRRRQPNPVAGRASEEARGTVGRSHTVPSNRVLPLFVFRQTQASRCAPGSSGRRERNFPVRNPPPRRIVL